MDSSLSGWRAGCVWCGRIRQIGHSTETHRRRRLRAVASVRRPQYSHVFQREDGGTRLAPSPVSNSRALYDVPQAAPFAANVQSAQRRKCRCKSPRSIALSRRERDGVRGPGDIRQFDFFTISEQWASAGWEQRVKRGPRSCRWKQLSARFPKSEHGKREDPRHRR